MQDPEYRIVTLCQHGMSTALKAYLNRRVDADTPMLMRDVIALELTKTFKASSLPFAGTCLGWAASEYPAEVLQDWLNTLNGLTLKDSNEPVAFEIFTQKVDGGTIALAGFYPLANLAPADVTKEHKRVSFLMNTEVRTEIFQWGYNNLLYGALQTDRIGAFCAILAEQEKIADLKLQEAIALLTNEGKQTRQ